MAYKVLHIKARLGKYGGSRNVFETVKGLQHKYEMGLIVGPDIDWETLNTLGRVKIIEVRSFIREIHPIKDLQTLIALYKVIKEESYDIVHTHEAKGGMLGRMAAKWAKTPVIVHGLHGSTFHPSQPSVARYVCKSLERFNARFTTHFVSVGDDVKKRYLRNGVGTEADYTIIHSGMDLDRFLQCGDMTPEQIREKKQSLGLDENDFVIGKVASMEPRKGHLYCIDAAEKITAKQPQVKFLFVGDGWEREKVEAEVKRRNLERNVIFTGFRKDVAEVMATFDVLVHASVLEGLPQVFVQSCAVGRPIVTFEVDGAHDMIDEGENGFIVPLKDVNALIEKLNLLISNPGLAKSMGLKGKRKVNDSWKIESMVEATDELYQRLLKEHA